MMLWTELLGVVITMMVSLVTGIILYVKWGNL